MYSFSYLEPVCFSMSGSKCCFLTCIQISQEAGKVVLDFHLLKNFPQFAVLYTVHSKGDQSWVFFGRNDPKAETPVLWPPSCEELTHWKRL